MSVNSVQPSWSILIRSPVLMCALGFGAGLVPKAPGTFGTLVAVPIVILLGQTTYWVLPLTALLFFAVGIPVCNQASKYYQAHDHSSIVWDELVGFMITMSFVPINLVSLVIGFVLFRIFDILKPWPISWLDKNVQGSWGIMVDDVAAGLAANVCLQLCLWQGWIVS
ncbi:phosphatidylglycerophosphatase A [Pseudomonadota bacterium]